MSCDPHHSETPPFGKDETEFNAEFCFQIMVESSEVVISLYGYKFLRQDKLFGSATVKVADVATGKFRSGWLELKNASNESRGALLIDACFISAASRNRHAEFVANNLELVRLKKILFYRLLTFCVAGSPHFVE